MVQAEEHLPQPVKEQLHKWGAAVNSAWHVHVVKAKWVSVGTV